MFSSKYILINPPISLYLAYVFRTLHSVKLENYSQKKIHFFNKVYIFKEMRTIQKRRETDSTQKALIRNGYL